MLQRGEPQMVRGRLITGPLPTVDRNQTLVGGWGPIPIADLPTPLPGVARNLPVPPPPVGRTTSLLDSEPESEENSFIPPSTLKMAALKKRGIPAPTMRLDENATLVTTVRQPNTWRRAFLAGSLLGGLVVGVLAFRTDLVRFVRSRLHKGDVTAAAAAVAPPPAAAAAPAPPAPPPPTPPPATAAVEAPAPAVVAPAAAEPKIEVLEPVGAAAAAEPAPLKAATAGDRRTLLRSRRVFARPAGAAGVRRKAAASRAASASKDAPTEESAPAPAKGEGWVDPFSQ